MPRYYFHLHNDVDAADLEGKELNDLEAARACAIGEVRAIAAETLKTTGRFVRDHRIDIEDGAGNVLDSVSFAEAVEIDG